MMHRIIHTIVLAGIASVFGCGDQGTSFIGEAHVIIRFTPAAGTTLNARVGNSTFTSGGQYSVTFDDLGSAREISGTFTGTGLTIYFSTSTTAGVQSGSVKAVSGPQPSVTNCSIAFLPGTAGTHEFRVQFKTTGTQGLVCNVNLA
jgi:hypothetical protein